MANHRTTYYPRCKAALQFVFDDFGVASPAVGPTRPEDLNKPLVIGVNGDLTPKNAQVHLNGYKEADTFSVEFDARRFPFTPEVVRAGEANIWLFQLTSADDTTPSWATDQPRIKGLFDNLQFRAGEGGRWFLGDGRDYTALLIDKQWTQLSMHNGRVPVGQDLQHTVQAIVNEAVVRAGVATTIRVGGKTVTVPNTLTVEFHGESVDPTVRSVDKGITQKQVTTKPPVVGHGHARTHKAGLPQRSGRTYWDVIYGLCLKHGFICYVRGDKLIIGKPQTLTSESSGNLYRMVLGRNLKTLVIERHMAKEAVPQIIAVSYDPRTGKTLEARYPEKGQERVTGANTVKEESRIVEAGYGITDLNLLRDVAATYYYHVARGEAKIRWSTKDLTDLSEQEKDLTALNPGEPVTIGFNDFDERAFQEMTFSQREALLNRLGYEAQVANVLATQYDKLPRDPYYTKAASFEWDVESGITISTEQINFISVKRDGAGLNSGPVSPFTFDKPSARQGRAHKGGLRAH